MPLLERALNLRSGSAEAMLALGECEAGSGRLPEARTQLEAAVKLAPDSVEAHRALAQVDTRLGLAPAAERERASVGSLERLAGEHSKTLRVNDIAPDFTLAEAGSGKSVRLSDLRKSPVVLVFGSYTCPNFRGSADSLNILFQRYSDQARFFLIYIREAHSTADWQSTRNEREGVTLPPAKTLQEKQSHAAMCSTRLHLQFPALVDGLDGAVESAYAGWPSHAFVVGPDGRILYSSGLTALDFRPDDMEKALRQGIARSRREAGRSPSSQASRPQIGAKNRGSRAE